MAPSRAEYSGLPHGIRLSRFKGIWGEILRLIKYGLVGLSNTVVSMAVLNLFFLAWAPTSNLSIVIGSTLAYAAGDLNSYWWNRAWTFRVRNNWAQFARFGLLSLACMALNAAIVWGSSGLLLQLLLPSWLLGNAAQISMSLSGAIGYVFCRNWVFRHKPQHQQS